MAERFTHLLLLLAVLLACSSTKTESHVSVPTTLDAIKELHDPPNVVVVVERRKNSPGGGVCGNSPVCFLAVPVDLVKGLFPDKWDEATVTTNGKVSYEASFATDGRFIHSSQTDPKKVSRFGALELKELKKRVIVQVSEAAVGPGGKPGPARRVKILPQVDLIADYEAALKKESDADDRAKLITEAVMWLGDESKPFLLKCMSDAGEPDKSRAEVLTGLCNRTGEDTTLLIEVLDAAVKQPTPHVARAGARCGGRADVPRRPEFTRALVKQVCANTAGDTDLHVKVLESLPKKPAWTQVKATTKACKEISARLTLRHVFGQPINSKELAKAVGGGGPRRTPRPTLVLSARSKAPD